MNIDEYRYKVIELFKSGNATDAQWGEMANSVLETSERDGKTTFQIDNDIDPENAEPPQ